MLIKNLSVSLVIMSTCVIYIGCGCDLLPILMFPHFKSFVFVDRIQGTSVLLETISNKLTAICGKAFTLDILSNSQWLFVLSDDTHLHFHFGVNYPRKVPTNVFEECDLSRSILFIKGFHPRRVCRFRDCTIYLEAARTLEEEITEIAAYKKKNFANRTWEREEFMAAENSKYWFWVSRVNSNQ